MTLHGGTTKEEPVAWAQGILSLGSSRFFSSWLESSFRFSELEGRKVYVTFLMVVLI